MLQPKRTKFRKSHTMRLNGVASRGNKVSFGDFALQATEGGHVDSREIEAARMAIMRKVKRAGKLYIRIFPDRPFTRKPRVDLMITPMTASPHTAPKSDQPHAPRSTLSVNGVYVPAMSR